jgi:hypothetical protein
MRVAGGQVSILKWKARILLDREEELWYCVIKTPIEKLRDTDRRDSSSYPGAWAQT